MGSDRAPSSSGDFARALGAARDGSSVGFEWLWKVASFARVQGHQDPDGLANLVFLVAFRRIGTFHGDSSAFVSYLFAIARNKVIDERRQQGRRPLTSPLASAGEQVGGNVEDDALDGLGDDARLALSLLTDEQREVIVLRLIADLSIEQVSHITGRSISAVKAMQHRALATMRREISAEAVSR